MGISLMFRVGCLKFLSFIYFFPRHMIIKEASLSIKKKHFFCFFLVSHFSYIVQPFPPHAHVFIYVLFPIIHMMSMNFIIILNIQNPAHQH